MVGPCGSLLILGAGSGVLGFDPTPFSLTQACWPANSMLLAENGVPKTVLLAPCLCASPAYRWNSSTICLHRLHWEVGSTRTLSGAHEVSLRFLGCWAAEA